MVTDVCPWAIVYLRLCTHAILYTFTNKFTYYVHKMCTHTQPRIHERLYIMYIIIMYIIHT